MHLIAAVVEQDCAFGEGRLDLVSLRNALKSSGIEQP